jgi:hypothetical protein
MSHLCYKCKKPVDLTESHEGLHRECFCEWFGVELPEPFEDLVARNEVRTGEWTEKNSSFFHGKFRKYSARLGSRSYILKVQQPEVPELPATEFLCNQIAASLGIDVPEHYFIRFQNTLDTFVSTNLMQKFPDSDLVHIYRFLQHPGQYNCEELLKVIETETKQIDEIYRFIQLCLFDALIGNHDRHGRNLGLIPSKSRTYLAPFYDNPSYLALEIPILLDAQHEPRGAIGTKKSQEPTMRDYVDEWVRLGFSEPILDFKRTIHIANIETLIAGSFISPKRQSALKRLIQRRYQELCHASERL